MKLDTIISHCSLDTRFIQHCVKKAETFSDRVIVVHCDKLFSGQAEDKAAIDMARAACPNAEFLEFPHGGRSAKWLHNAQRWAGFERSDAPWLLFLDADEIVDADRFKEWLADFNENPFAPSVSFRCYWYFRSARFQAIQQERCGLLVRRKEMTFERSHTERERYAYADLYGYRHGVTGLDNGPLMHHYSWVHTKEELLAKTAGWGHCGDGPWAEAIQKEFSRDFAGTDFVHGYRYRTVEPFVDVGL